MRKEQYLEKEIKNLSVFAGLLERALVGKGIYVDCSVKVKQAVFNDVDRIWTININCRGKDMQFFSEDALDKIENKEISLKAFDDIIKTALHIIYITVGLPNHITALEL